MVNQYVKFMYLNKNKARLQRKYKKRNEAWQ